MDENPIIGNMKAMNLNEKSELTRGTRTIDDIPDAVLEHILSFLPIRHAIRTSILSKRWRYLWTSCPDALVFDNLFHPSRRGDREAFARHVERMLLLYAHSPMKKFRLRCEVFDDAPQIIRWVTKVARTNVQDCSILLSHIQERFMLPDCLFLCSTLTHLYLSMLSWPLKLPPQICLPSLKTLVLGHMTFPDTNSIQQLLSSCPALVELKIRYCRPGKLRTISISDLKVKSLSICDNDFSHCREDHYRFVIRECVLHSFHICGWTLNNYLELPVIHSMKNLELGDLDINMLGKILQHTPHLRSLYLFKGLTGSCDEENDQIFDPVPHCLNTSLTEIKIDLHFNAGEPFAVKKLLSCAAVLKQLEIRYLKSFKMVEMDLQKQFLNYARGLENCKITFGYIFGKKILCRGYGEA